MSVTRNKKLGEELADGETSQQADNSAAAATAAAAAAAAATAAVPSGSGTPTAPPKAKGPKKPKFPCGKCDLEVSCGVACNSCDVWFHDKCVDGMTREYFDNCKKAQELFGFTAFLCKICKKVFNVLNKM